MNVLTPSQLSDRLRQPDSFRLVDVREDEEWKICRIEGAELLPLSRFAEQAPAALLPAEPVVLYCHHGVRSERAGLFLESLGYGNVAHLAGGIDRWSVEIDSKVPRY